MTQNSSATKATVAAVIRLALGLIVIGAMLFWPAGTFDYWQGWMWLAVLGLALAFILVYLAQRDPALLDRRSRYRETRREQRLIIALSALCYLAAFLLPGFDRRFGWSDVPAWVSIAAQIVVTASLVFIFLVYKINSYASRVIEVQEEQQVIASGPYALVRHPMYLGMMLMIIFSPLALGSYWAVPPTLILPFLLAARAKDEETLLADELKGYREYMQKTRYRLFPGIW
ncbi:MAG: methyltransferase family protein [Chloroflexota bacterium]